MSGTQSSQMPSSASASHAASSSGGSHSSKQTDPYEGTNYLFVNIILAVFFGLMLATLIFRILNIGNMYLRFLNTTGHGREKQVYWKTNKTEWWPWIKRHLLYAPLWSKRHNQVIKISSVVTFGTLPSRFHSLLIFVFVAMNLAYCAVLDYGNKEQAAVWAEWRGRTGMLATINLIPCFIFALRNNPLIPLLQVSYDTFNLLHRWLARIVIVESILHTLAWLIPTIRTKGWDKGVKMSVPHSEFLTWGVVATCVFVFMGIQAWSPLRHAFYETFLNIHKVAAVAAIVGVYLHCVKGHLDEDKYCQIAIAFWAVEYLFRSARIIYRNWSRQSGFTRVTIEALPAEACRITFHLARPWKFSPGTHVHAYLPRYSLWSSHPFSVAWSEDHVRTSLSDEEKLPTTGPMKASELDLARSNIRTEVSLIVRSFTGLTGNIYKAASKAPNKMITTWGAIEGPYGGHESLDSFGTVLLFAGGVGITHQLPYIRHLVAGAGESTVAAKKIILVWSVPTTENLEWIRPYMDEILRYPGRRDVLKIMLFVTKPRSRNEIMSNTGSVAMYPGRCNPQTIVQKEFLEREGSMAVTVCGPGPFSDSVRQASRELTEIGSVTFAEEAFTY